VAHFQTNSRLLIKVTEGSTPGSVSFEVIDPSSEEPRASFSLSIPQEQATQLGLEIVRLSMRASQ
jgi:hypothetical protein